MKTCGVFHPTDMSTTCALKANPHPVHIGGFPPVEWTNDDFVAPVRRHQASGTKEVMAKVASQTLSEQVFREESPYMDL